ncbi:PIN domain-containing protein [Phaeodactylibacter sp.]|uniref:PIN domain-containing protein n=1 Tax=Phaeodactylibacter sp. TaxID=1940289 RepID=UPI003440526B
MNYFFDTNAILIYLRDHVQKDWLDKNYDPLGDDNTAMISVVVLGELESLYLRNNWGRRRIENLRIFLRKFLITDINSRDIVRRYGEIDAFRPCLDFSNWSANVPFLLILRYRTGLHSAAMIPNLRLV